MSRDQLKTVERWGKRGKQETKELVGINIKSRRLR